MILWNYMNNKPGGKKKSWDKNEFY
jgi:hypothetical protein